MKSLPKWLASLLQLAVPVLGGATLTAVYHDLGDLGLALIWVAVGFVILLGFAATWKLELNRLSKQESQPEVLRVVDDKIPGPFGYVAVATITKFLTRQDNEAVLKWWWPDGQKAKVIFDCTDTTDIVVAYYAGPTRLPIESYPVSIGTAIWAIPAIRTWGTEFDTKAGVWFFVARRPKTNVLDPRVKIEIGELRKTG